MGYSLSWIARAGTSTEELLGISDRSPTGERLYDLRENGFYLVEIPTPDPWIILLALGGEFLDNLDPEQARLLSEDGGKTLFFYCVDAVMSTELTCFENGARVWSVTYRGEDESSRPTMVGEVPSVCQEILEELETEQRTRSSDEVLKQRRIEIDFIYDLPAELGLRLVGFRHDAPHQTAGLGPFQVLAFEGEKTASATTAPESPHGPLSDLLRQLFLSGCLHWLPVNKTEDQLTIGTPELQVVAVEGKKGRIRLAFNEDGKKSTYRGSVAGCVKKIDAFCGPRARRQGARVLDRSSLRIQRKLL